MLCTECGIKIEIGEEYREILGDPIHERCIRFDFFDISAEKKVWCDESEELYSYKREDYYNYHNY